jgi:hypothetical protein
MVIGALLSSTITQGASPYAPLPGAYRPTEGQATTTPQFNPSGNRPIPMGSYPSNPPQAAYPPPPGYSNNNNRYDMPGFNVNPGNMVNNMFNTKNNLPYGYPSPPVSGNLAPVYEPPIPSSNPNWGSYGYQQQPATPGYSYQQPVNPQYWQQPAATPGNTYSEIAPSAQYSSPAQAASATGNPPASAYSAPRPFSNPQETGNAFVQRQGGMSSEHSDNRFRPPQLKGSP